MRITWNELTVSPAGVDLDGLLSAINELAGNKDFAYRDAIPGVLARYDEAQRQASMPSRAPVSVPVPNREVPLAPPPEFAQPGEPVLKEEETAILSVLGELSAAISVNDLARGLKLFTETARTRWYMSDFNEGTPAVRLGSFLHYAHKPSRKALNFQFALEKAERVGTPPKYLVFVTKTSVVTKRDGVKMAPFIDKRYLLLEKDKDGALKISFRDLIPEKTTDPK